MKMYDYHYLVHNGREQMCANTRNQAPLRHHAAASAATTPTPAPTIRTIRAPVREQECSLIYGLRRRTHAFVREIHMQYNIVLAMGPLAKRRTKRSDRNLSARVSRIPEPFACADDKKTRSRGFLAQ